MSFGGLPPHPFQGQATASLLNTPPGRLYLGKGASGGRLRWSYAGDRAVFK